MEKILRYKLVSRLRGFEQEAKTLRAHINKSKDKKRPIGQLQLAKQVIGVDARHHLLAYAFLRNKPYHLVEPRCRADNKPRVDMILDVMANFYYWIVKKPTKEEIEAWMAGTGPVIEKSEVQAESTEEEKVMPAPKPSLFNKALSLMLYGLNGSK